MFHKRENRENEENSVNQPNTEKNTEKQAIPAVPNAESPATTTIPITPTTANHTSPPPQPKPGITSLPLVIFIAVLVIVFAFIGYNVYTVAFPAFATQQNTSAVVQKPVLLLAGNCPNCIPLEAVAQQVLKEFETVSSTSEQGKKLIETYSISKLPSLIVYSESSLSVPLVASEFEQRAGALIFEAPSPPFIDVKTGELKGSVDVIAITPINCSQCTSVESVLKELKSNNVLLQEQRLQEDSSEAKSLIAKYNVSFLPAFIFSPVLLQYPTFNRSWSILGSVETDGSLVMRQPVPPFKNLSNNNSIDGLVSVVYLTDEACQTCYNVSIHRRPLLGYGVFIANESFVDVLALEGQALVEKYNLTEVPTVVLSKEAGVYPALKQLWGTVGSIERDGVFVFRKLNSIPSLVYRDLPTGSIINSSAVAA